MTDGRLHARRIRAARNQAMFREVNERILELSSERPWAPGFVCECESAECTATLALAREQYETVRSDPACFLVAPGHEVLEVEEIVAQGIGYTVVRKLGAGRAVAVRYDPRAQTR